MTIGQLLNKTPRMKGVLAIAEGFWGRDTIFDETSKLLLVCVSEPARRERPSIAFDIHHRFSCVWFVAVMHQPVCHIVLHKVSVIDQFTAGASWCHCRLSS